MDDCAKSRYNIILGRDLLTSLWFKKRVSEGGDETFERCSDSTVNLAVFKSKILNTDKITSKDFFTDE